MDNLKIEIPGKPAYLTAVRLAISSIATTAGFSLDDVEDVKTAVSEAVTNCIVHAYPESVGRIRLKMRILEGGLLEIAVQDWGKGIEDVEKAREPLFTTGGEERGGMGFTIMESFTDKLRVRSRPGRGTVVIMQRQIRSRARRT